MNSTQQRLGTARRTQWLRQWSSFLIGVMIGLLIITPVLAGTLGTRVVGDDDARNMAVLGSAAFLALALILQAVAAAHRPRYRSVGDVSAGTAGPQEKT
jgi:biotin transporter BioY